MIKKFLYNNKIKTLEFWQHKSEQCLYIFEYITQEIIYFYNISILIARKIDLLSKINNLKTIKDWDLLFEYILSINKGVVGKIINNTQYIVLTSKSNILSLNLKKL